MIDRATIALLGLTAVGVTGMITMPRHFAETQQSFQKEQASTLHQLLTDSTTQTRDLFNACALPPAPKIITTLSPGQTLVFTMPGQAPQGEPPPQSEVECLAPGTPAAPAPAPAATPQGELLDWWVPPLELLPTEPPDPPLLRPPSVGERPALPSSPAPERIVRAPLPDTIERRVPEPETLALLAGGAAVVLWLSWRQA